MFGNKMFSIEVWIQHNDSQGKANKMMLTVNIHLKTPYRKQQFAALTFCLRMDV